MKPESQYKDYVPTQPIPPNPFPLRSTRYRSQLEVIQRDTVSLTNITKDTTAAGGAHREGCGRDAWPWSVHHRMQSRQFPGIDLWVTAATLAADAVIQRAALGSFCLQCTV